jgi:hypothetical protein
MKLYFFQNKGVGEYKRVHYPKRQIPSVKNLVNTS